MDKLDLALAVMRGTILALLAVSNWCGTVQITVHINANEKSVKVVPMVMPVV